MLSFLKRFFGAKPTVSPCPEAPYKVEASSQFPFPKAVKEEKKPAVKKPAAKKPAAPKKTRAKKSKE
jgi:hypothetical protein